MQCDLCLLYVQVLMITMQVMCVYSVLAAKCAFVTQIIILFLKWSLDIIQYIR